MGGVDPFTAVWDQSLPVFKAFLYQICGNWDKFVTGDRIVYRVLGFWCLLNLRCVCVRHVVGRPIGLGLKIALVVKVCILRLAG